MLKSELFVYGLLETTRIYPGTPVNLHEAIHHLYLLFKSCLLHNSWEERFYVNFANWEDILQGRKRLKLCSYPLSLALGKSLKGRLIKLNSLNIY